MKTRDPFPKIYKIIKKRVKEDIGAKIRQIKYELDELEDNIIEEVYLVMSHHIDDAIEQAYNDGFEEGRTIKKTYAGMNGKRHD